MGHLLPTNVGPSEPQNNGVRCPPALQPDAKRASDRCAALRNAPRVPNARATREYARTIEVLLDARAWTRARWVASAQLARVADDHWLWAQLSLTYFAEGRHTEALEAIDRAALAAPTCAMVLWYRSAILAAKQDGLRATHACQMLLELAPHLPEADGCVPEERQQALLQDAARHLAHLEVHGAAEQSADPLRALRRWTRTVPLPDVDEERPH